MKTPTRPVMRYFGGKWKVAPWIISHFPPHRVYTESFGGGASVLMRKPVAYGEVYNDLDGRVVNVFRVLQKPTWAKRLERKLRVTPFAREEFELSYKRSRDPVEDARRTLIASFMGFGSDSVTRGCRTGFRCNSNKAGTTPAHDWHRWPDQVERFTERLKYVIIENRDALEVMASQDEEGALHYVDPPYVHATRVRMHGRRGYQHELDDQAHLDLLAFLGTLKGMVVLSGYAHPLYDGLVKAGWLELKSPALAFGSTIRTEVLWLNPSAARAQVGQIDFSFPSGAQPSHP